MQRLILVCALVGAVALFAYSIGVSKTNLAFFVLYSAFSTWRGRKQRRETAAFWAIVWEVRMASQPQRAEMLASLEPAKLRDAVAAILAKDGSEIQNGDVERFPFPDGLVRLYRRRYWIFWSLTVVVLLLASFVETEFFVRVVALVVAGMCAYGAWTSERKEQFVQTILEVTPFRISETYPSGLTRTISWSRALELRDEPGNSRWLLGASHDEGENIVLDYRRMGFARLLELVIQYGRFRPVDEPATEPP
jgi:hypothetical protein